MKARAKKTVAPKRQQAVRNRPMAISGIQTLRTAPQLRDKILQALASRKPLIIDAGTADAVDIGTVQVLVAAQKSAVAANQQLSIVAQANSPVVALMKATGFFDQRGTPLVAEAHAWTIVESTKQ